MVIGFQSPYESLVLFERVFVLDMLYLEGFDEFCESKFLLSRILDLLRQLLLLPFQIIDLPLLVPCLLLQLAYFKLQLRFLAEVRLKGLFETLKFI